MVQPSKPKNQQRTAIVYFGSQRDDYLRLVEAADSAAFLRFVQHPLQQQLKAEKHRADCPDRSRYTSHGKRERTVQEWLGGQTVVPIYRVRCCGCGVVFTVLSTKTEIITQPFKKIPRLRQISPIEGCVIIYSQLLTQLHPTLP